MGWYDILDADGVPVRRVFASTIEDLALACPEGHTAQPWEPEILPVPIPLSE